MTNDPICYNNAFVGEIADAIYGEVRNDMNEVIRNTLARVIKPAMMLKVLNRQHGDGASDDAIYEIGNSGSKELMSPGTMDELEDDLYYAVEKLLNGDDFTNVCIAAGALATGKLTEMIN